MVGKDLWFHFHHLLVLILLEDIIVKSKAQSWSVGQNLAK